MYRKISTHYLNYLFEHTSIQRYYKRPTIQVYYKIFVLKARDKVYDRTCKAFVSFQTTCALLFRHKVLILTCVICKPSTLRSTVLVYLLYFAIHSIREV